MPRLALINPASNHKSNWHRRQATHYPPLGLAYLAAVTPPHWNIQLLDENIRLDHFPEVDLVGITSFTATINRAYEIASYYQEREIPVVMGGIHATMLTEEALQYVDSVVQGEGEWVWPQILKDFEAGKLERIYKSVPEDLSHLPLPRRDLFDPSYVWGSIQTSRGCPMNCNFCSVTAFNGRRFRQRPIEDILRELKTIHPKNIFFVDDNILGYGKSAEDRAIRLFRGIVEQGFRKRFFCQTSLNFSENPEVLKWASKAGCKIIFVGLESVSEDSLKYLGKAYNLKRGVSKYTTSIRRCHDYGIGVFGALMFGNDEEDSEIFQRTLNFIQDSGLDVIQITFTTPLPGTKLFQDFQNENRLTHTNFPQDWKAYRFSQVLFKPKGISVKDLYRGMAMVKDRLYKPGCFRRRVFRTLFETKNLTTALLSYKFNKAYRKGYQDTSYFQSYSLLGRHYSRERAPGR